MQNYATFAFRFRDDIMTTKHNKFLHTWLSTRSSIG